jgi:hypothetical protein
MIKLSANDKFDGIWKEEIDGLSLFTNPKFTRGRGGLWKTKKDMSQDSRFPGRNLNQGPREYDSE